MNDQFVGRARCRLTVEQPQRVTSHRGRRSHWYDAAALRRDEEELFHSVAWSERCDREGGGAVSDRQLDLERESSATRVVYDVDLTCRGIPCDHTTRFQSNVNVHHRTPEEEQAGDYEQDQACGSRH